MSVTPSGRPTREWPLLILTLAIVGAICFPIWQYLATPDGGAEMWSNWTPERWGRLLFGPEQIGCYVFFTWGCLILFSRYLEVRRQRRAFGMPLLPTEAGSRILHEDARLWQRQVEQSMQQRGPFILANMIRVALGKYAISRSSKEVAETVRTQAEVDQGRLVASMATVHYLAWAIPALGFLGTVRGLAGSLSMAGQDHLTDEVFLRGVTNHLNVAFDCTLIALVLSLGVMFLVHTVQREEEALVIDCQQYCIEHLVNRMYEPEVAVDELDRVPSHFGEDGAYRPNNMMSKRSARITP